jgi:hypothetical protein
MKRVWLPFVGVSLCGLFLSSCASTKPVVTFDNATKAPVMLNISGAGVDKVVLNPDEGAELRFDESFPQEFNIDRWGRVFNYRLSMDPTLLDQSALIVGDDMKVYLVQDGKVRNPQPQGFPLVPVN